MNLTPLGAQLQARRQWPWLSPMIAALSWVQGEKESYKQGVVTYVGELTPAAVTRIATTVGVRGYSRGRGRSANRWKQAREHGINDLFPDGWRDGEHYPDHAGYNIDDTYERLGGDDENDPPDDGDSESEDGDSDEPAHVRTARGLLAGHESAPERVKEACSSVPVHTLDWTDRLRGALVTIPIPGASHRTYSKIHRLQGCVGSVILGKATAYQAKVSVVVDTSGSMWDDLDRIKSTVERIVKSVGYDCEVIQCDTKVRHVGHGRKAVSQWHGGTGTIIGPGVAAATGKAIVIITDGYIESDLVKPSVPVVWCMTTDVKPYPWGTYVRAA